jgi:hypothetical protein
MKVTKLISLIAKKEGKKVQTPVAQVREIMNVLVTLCAEDPEAMRALKTYLKVAVFLRKNKLQRAKAKLNLQKKKKK